MWMDIIGNVEPMVFYIFSAVSGVILMLAVGLIISGCFAKQSRPGSSSDFFIIIGGLTLMVSVMMNSVLTDWLPLSNRNVNPNSPTDQESTANIFCQTHPAILTAGLTFFIGGILIKMCSIFHYYRHNSTKLPRSEEWKPSIWMLSLIIISSCVLVAWELAYPMNAMVVSRDDGTTGGPLYQCKGGKEIEYWRIAISCYHGVLLLLASLISFCATAVARCHFEASAMILVIFNTICAVVAGCVVELIVSGLNPTIRQGIEGALISWSVFLAFMILLIGKVLGERCGGGDDREMMLATKDDYTYENPREDSRPSSYVNSYNENTEKTRPQSQMTDPTTEVFQY